MLEDNGGKQDTAAFGDRQRTEAERYRNGSPPWVEGTDPIRRGETTRELIMRIKEPRTAWKRGVLGGLLFLIILMISLFLAAQYVRKREGTLKKVTSPKMAVRLPVIQEQKIVIKRYCLKPFLLRIKGKKRDRFLTVRVTIEFIREKIPPETSSRREVLRTLIYKQLIRYFSNGEKAGAHEKQFKEELIPILNTFFKGGGVYDIRLNRFVLR